MDKLLARIPQMIVHFACTIPLKTELKATEREALKVMLQDLDTEQFQIFSEMANQGNPNSPVLFGAQRQYPLGAGIITAPSLIFTPGGINIFRVLKLGDSFLTATKSLTGEEFNQKMKEVLFRIQDITKSKFTRAGKIFELVVGPLASADKEMLVKKLIANPAADICEINLTFTRIVAAQKKKLNLVTAVQFNQLNPDQPVPVTVKIDINNRAHEISLEPRDVEYIFKEADNLLQPHLEDLLPFNGG